MKIKKTKIQLLLLGRWSMYSSLFLPLRTLKKPRYHVQNRRKETLKDGETKEDG